MERYQIRCFMLSGVRRAWAKNHAELALAMFDVGSCNLDFFFPSAFAIARPVHSPDVKVPCLATAVGGETLSLQLIDLHSWINVCYAVSSGTEGFHLCRCLSLEMPITTILACTDDTRKMMKNDFQSQRVKYRTLDMPFTVRICLHHAWRCVT